MKSNLLPAVACLFDGASGIYIPQRFAEEFGDAEGWSGFTAEDVATLAKGPNDESVQDAYWETWCEVIDCARYTDSAGNVYSLYQDGDVFIYCIDRMSVEEQINTFGEYSPPDRTVVYMVLSHAASAIEYGEPGDDDAESIAHYFAEQYPSPRYVVSVETALTDGFGRCEVTGERGDLVGVLVTDMEYKPGQPAAQ